MSPAGADHGSVAAAILVSLGTYVKQKQLGRVYAAETGFRIARNPDTVRAPDAAFVRSERVVKTKRFFEGPPDVAFEVVSPGDSYSEVEEKTLDWLRAGTQAVVIVDPGTESVRIRRTAETVNVADTLTLDEIPGWNLPLADLFE